MFCTSSWEDMISASRKFEAMPLPSLRCWVIHLPMPDIDVLFGEIRHTLEESMTARLKSLNDLAGVFFKRNLNHYDEQKGERLTTRVREMMGDGEGPETTG